MACGLLSMKIADCGKAEDIEYVTSVTNDVIVQ